MSVAIATHAFTTSLWVAIGAFALSALSSLLLPSHTGENGMDNEQTGPVRQPGTVTNGARPGSSLDASRG